MPFLLFRVSDDALPPLLDEGILEGAVYHISRKGRSQHQKAQEQQYAYAEFGALGRFFLSQSVFSPFGCKSCRDIL